MDVNDTGSNSGSECRKRTRFNITPGVEHAGNLHAVAAAQAPRRQGGNCFRPMQIGPDCQFEN